MITVNGEKLEFVRKTIAELLEILGYDEKRVAVELNGNIAPKAEYKNIMIHDDDKLEIVRFVGGG
ncbi:MAG: sulfur carrier protein ThiS [Oscillospiraceae bacterium]|nr:sulfur carrier protein ThiS [Ruminococcus sp.]MDE6707360.1 sulfur carrier protein ThiS [Oscillospiraceae bacterium]